MPHNPRRLRVLDFAFALTVDVHRVLENQFQSIANTSPGMRSQILRAADSIPLNISEAAGQTSNRRTLAQLMIAVGSCNELEMQLRLAFQLGAIDEEANRLALRVQSTRRMLYGFKRHLEQRDAPRSAARARVERAIAEADAALSAESDHESDEALDPASGDELPAMLRES